MRYIVVGDVERLSTNDPPFAGAANPYEHYASAEVLAALDRIVGSDLRVVLRSGHTTVNEVILFPAIPPDTAVGAAS